LAAVVGLSNAPNKIYPTIASDAIGTGDCARVSNSLHKVLHVMQLVSAAKNLVRLLMDLPGTRTSISQLKFIILETTTIRPAEEICQ
jgi:hypothetical protein